MSTHTHFTLDNGLHIVVDSVPNSKIAVVNVMYHVGSCHERPNKTGLAHFFEHLMFTGSKHIQAYDKTLQAIGGMNNAYTSLDVTNYYCTVPANNLSTVFWLESDRMLGLAYDEQAIETQRKVVIEEFRETSISQPYGDAWHHLLPLAYQVHPYSWPTIGKEIHHIAHFTLRDIQAFAERFYNPSNAVVVVSGGVTAAEVAELSDHWFAPLQDKRPNDSRMRLPQEPIQTTKRSARVVGKVPQHKFYRTYPTPARSHVDYPYVHLLAKYLGGGEASPLSRQLVKEQQLFTQVSAYTTETIDPGLLVIQGSLAEGVTFEQVEQGLAKVLQQVVRHPCTAQDWSKVRNQVESEHAFDQIDLSIRAEQLAMATLLGDPALFGQEIKRLADLDPERWQEIATTTLAPHRSSTLHYAKQT